MADVSAWTENGFTREQAVFLEARIMASQKERSSIDRQTLMWFLGGIVALGIFGAGTLYTGIRDLRMELLSIRTEITTMRTEMTTMLKELGDRISVLAEKQVRLETTLDERLPRRE